MSTTSDKSSVPDIHQECAWENKGRLLDGSGKYRFKGNGCYRRCELETCAIPFGCQMVSQEPIIDKRAIPADGHR